MAAKKTETKVTKKPAEKINFAAMSASDLQKALAEKQQDLLDAKRSHASGELVNPRVLGATRKEIARIKTALTAAEKESK